MTTVNIYLTFNENCEEAFEFYRSVFGGEFSYMGRFSEMPGEYGISESEHQKIMHVSLPISKETNLMGSDVSEKAPYKITPGNNFSISVFSDDKSEANRYFKELSTGGTVGMTMKETFWGSYFGTLTDQFGVDWMINYDLNQEKTKQPSSLYSYVRKLLSGERTKGATPDNHCPNCWGKQEYEGKFLEAVTKEKIDLNNVDAKMGWIQAYATKNFEGIRLKESDEFYKCPKCKDRFKK